MELLGIVRGTNETIIGEYQSHLLGEERANISMLSEARLVRLGLRMSGRRDPRWASATCLEKVKLPAKRVLHIDHLFARMQRLNTYEARTNAMTRIGSTLSQVLPPPFNCE
jgi:hypothetical protein